jgi:hypothetical protein
MGRGVSYLNHAEVVLYYHYDADIGDDYDLASILWNEQVDSLTEAIQKRLPSYAKDDYSYNGDRETRIILSNELCVLGVSEYCGCCSLSVAPKFNKYGYMEPAYKEAFAIRHAKQIESALQACLDEVTGTRLKKLGTFSNGESVFELAKKG